MKKILMIALIVVTAQVSWGQRINHDPSYSMNNYKHPNKAAYAKEHNLDRAVKLEKSTVLQNDNYKQAYNNPKRSERFVVKTEAVNSNKSSKHPYGL